MYSTERVYSIRSALIHPGSGYCVAIILAGVFIVASMSKAWNPVPPATLIGYLLGISSSSSFLVVAVLTIVVAWESAIAMLLVCLPRARVTLVVVAATLSAFTVILVRLWFATDAPSCGCFGLLQREYVGSSPVPPGIIRNLLLLGALGFVALTRPRQVE